MTDISRVVCMAKLNSKHQAEWAIETKGLSKSFGDVESVKTLNLSVGHGELFGILGPDGAGKTTLFRILTSLLLPDAGSASVMGLDVVQDYKQIRQIIGYMPGKFSLYQDLSIKENLDFFASVYGTTLSENYDMIAPIYIQLERFANRRAGKLSGGMKQKLALCCALIHKPEILFLDEPTTGVDPVSRREFWDMLDLLRRDGLTIIASTPYMDEASRCDRIALMQGGTFLEVDSPQAIIEQYPAPLYAVRAKEMASLLLALRDSETVYSAYSFGEAYHVQLCDGASCESLQRELSGRGFLDVSMQQITPTVEDCFMDLLSKKSHDN